MSDQTPTPATDAGVPDFLARETAKNAPAIAAVVTETPAPVEATTTETPAKPAKTRTAKAAKPAKVTKAKHKPSDIVRTDANPAKSIVPVRFKEAYAENGGCNGDALAVAVKAFLEVKNADGRTVLSMENLAQLASDNAIDFAKYAHLNNGQKSMNVRNRLRGLLKAGTTVVVGKRKFSDVKKALAKPEVKAEPAQAAA